MKGDIGFYNLGDKKVKKCLWVSKCFVKFWVICLVDEIYKVFNIKIFRKVYFLYVFNIYIFVNLLFCCLIRGWIFCINEIVIYFFLLKVFCFRIVFLGILIVFLFCFVLIILFIYWFLLFVFLRWWFINVVLLMLLWKLYIYFIEIICSVKFLCMLFFYVLCSC